MEYFGQIGWYIELGCASSNMPTCLTNMFDIGLANKFIIDYTVESHVLKTADNDLNRGLLSFKHLVCPFS